jgi:alkylhydroperoxidase family enzyme
LKVLAHFFVDFENVQPPAEEFARLRGIQSRVWIFHGPHQTKFAADLVAAWQPLGERVRFVQSSKTGKNALDFHIAFTLGLAWQEDAADARSARYLVVSRDNGFEALFDHMRTLGATVGKAETLAEALNLAKTPAPAPPPAATLAEAAVVTVQAPGTTFAVASPALTAPAALQSNPPPVATAPRDTLSHDDVEKVIAGLNAQSANRPGNTTALRRHIVSLLRNQVSFKVSDAVIRKLKERGLITLSGDRVEYQLPDA